MYTSILSQFEIHHSKSDGFTEFSEYDKKTHFNFDFRWTRWARMRRASCIIARGGSQTHTV